jgi:4-hydroxyphenylpyruvate dioxygenase-like putative hemolysin
MAELFDNPMGLMGFEFIEFASPIPNTLEPIFERIGFTLVAHHRSKDVVLYRQGDINFIVNREPNSLAAYFAAEHGPSACGILALGLTGYGLPEALRITIGVAEANKAVVNVLSEVPA